MPTLRLRLEIPSEVGIAHPTAIYLGKNTLNLE